MNVDAVGDEFDVHPSVQEHRGERTRGPVVHRPHRVETVGDVRDARLDGEERGAVVAIGVAEGGDDAAPGQLGDQFEGVFPLRGDRHHAKLVPQPAVDLVQELDAYGEHLFLEYSSAFFDRAERALQVDAQRTCPWEKLFRVVQMLQEEVEALVTIPGGCHEGRRAPAGHRKTPPGKGFRRSVPDVVSARSLGVEVDEAGGDEEPRDVETLGVGGRLGREVLSHGENLPAPDEDLARPEFLRRGENVPACEEHGGVSALSA